MTATVSHRNTCRLCGAKDVRLVLKLEPIPLSEKYATDRQTARTERRFPVDVYMCADCGHVQHLDVINASDLWDSYTYFSGDAKGIAEGTWMLTALLDQLGLYSMEMFQQSREEVINRQTREISELSTPVVKRHGR